MDITDVTCFIWRDCRGGKGAPLWQKGGVGGIQLTQLTPAQAAVRTTNNQKAHEESR